MKSDYNRKFTKGNDYLTVKDGNWYLVKQSGQRTWVAMKLIGENNNIMLTGNGQKLWEDLNPNVTYSNPTRSHVDLKKAIMCILVGKPPMSDVTSEREGNKVIIEIKDY